MIYCVFTTTSHAARGISDYKHEAKAKKQVCVSVYVLTCIEVYLEVYCFQFMSNE